MPKIDETYIQTGKVYYVYKDFAALGLESEPAAQAAECAGQQGKYWGMHDRLFADTSQWARGGVGRAVEAFKQMAADLGLESESFAVCMTSEEVRTEIRGDFSEARSMGARGTPTLVIGKTVVPGFLPWEQFQPLIEQALTDIRSPSEVETADANNTEAHDIHWHARLEVRILGETRNIASLEEGSLIDIHHDRLTVVEALKQYNVPVSPGCIFAVCNSQMGRWRFTVNGDSLASLEEYVLQDGDEVVLVFE